uniref:NADH-ubiquinone oxidoreductase chain 4L n=1 Tax=Fulvia mutica TaxID=80828 RepID=T2HGU0_FULMU|nr:NADH dehydrogenase subunit 4L [Fulvia mutica]BAN79051.1 NADH dehydrogenase subunit 4L [Fulvia mutica]
MGLELVFLDQLLVMMLVLFSSSLCIIFSERHHVMMVMLGMEMMAVSLFGLTILLNYGFSWSFSLVFFTFAVCEAVLGFSLLVSVVRGFGSAKFSSLFMLKV